MRVENNKDESKTMKARYREWFKETARCKKVLAEVLASMNINLPACESSTTREYLNEALETLAKAEVGLEVHSL